MISAASQFRKSGFNDEDAAILAKVAAQYQNVADTAVSAEDAAASITSQIRAFGEDAAFATTVIDAYNEVANNFSIGTNDIASAMEVASSGLATYGNSFQQVIGLVTAGTEIMQGRSLQVARGLSTIASRIAKNQDALAEYGIAVQDTNGNLKSTYDVLAELKPKWDNMTDAQRVALGDTLAGTNQYKVLAAVLQNFEHATTATETALNSAGSAAQENAKYLESLEAREQSLKAEFEDFANRVLSKEVVAGFYDATEAALQFINTDFGAATTRIIGTTTAITSLVGILGTMGAKLVLVGKQLQSFGAANGVLGFLTTPKTLLIIAGVVTLIAALAERIRAAVKAAEDAKFENRLKKLEETQTEIKNTTTSLNEYRESLQKLNEVDIKDRASDWYKERAEIEANIKSAELYLEALKNLESRQAAATYQSNAIPTGYSAGLKFGGVLGGIKSGISTFAFGDEELKKYLTDALKTYKSEEEAIYKIAEAFATASENGHRIIKESAYEAALQIQDEKERLEALKGLIEDAGFEIRTATETHDSAFEKIAVLADKASNGVKNLTASEREMAEQYVNTYAKIIPSLDTFDTKTKQEAKNILALAAALSEFDMQAATIPEKIAWIANTFGMSATEAASFASAVGVIGATAVQAVGDVVLLSNGMYAAKSACHQLEDGTWELNEALEETSDSSEDVADSLNAYQKSIKQVTDDEKAFVNSLFDMNGNLTKAAQQALAADSAMASYAQKILEAQQAQLKANFSSLILALQNVGNAAMLSGQAISQMMSLAGTPITGIETKQGMARFKGYIKAQGYSSVQDYIRATGEKNYKRQLEELQKQMGSLSTYVPSTGGGGGSSSTTSQKSPAQIAAEAAAKAAKYRLDALQDELDALNDEKSALEDEIQRIQDEVKAEYQAEIDILNDKKEAIQEAYEAWEEDADAVLDRLKAEKDAIQSVIDAIDKEKEQLEAATAYATEYASRQIDEIDTRLDELDAREVEINKKYDDELDKLKTTNKELDKQIEREKLLQNLASAKNKKKRVYSAQQGYILVDDIAAISKAQAELDKFDRQQKQSLEEQEIENKRKQELLASGVEAERAALEEQKKLWEEYSKKWSSIVSDYEFKQNRLAYIQRYGKAIEQQNWQQRNRTVEQATKEYADIMARLLAEQERMAAKEAEIAAQEAAMDEARIANQKATAAIEKQISDLQDEMVAAQEARTRKQVESLNALADAIEDAQRRVNQAQKDYDSAQEDEGAYDVDKPRVLKQVGGKAPDDAKVGDYIATADGIYHITGGYAGHWKSRRVSGTEGRSDLNNARAAANWLVKNGYLTAGEFGYRSGTTFATPGLHMLGENGPELGVLSRGDGVIPADITRNLMNIGKNPEKFANAAVARNGGDIIMQGVTLAFPNVRDGSDAAAFTKNFVNLAHQYAYKR